ncbi:MAG: portal protein, partial [Candidatus Dormibacteria bacterium]
LVLAQDLFVSYFTKSLETAPRVTHLIPMSRNDLRERFVRGVFNEMDPDTNQTPSFRFTIDASRNEREGVQPNPSDYYAPYEMMEQHCWFDFDQDGYAEPYVVTFRLDTKQVFRIVARFTETNITFNETGDKIACIIPNTSFTKYPFIPSPDGGFYDLGFGALLGPINESINSAINELLDAGSLANAGGGFLGRGFKAKKGNLQFKLAEWKQVDCTGDDLRKNIVPLTAPQPSTVLFQLLGLLIQYGQQIAGATDILQGQNPGQNTPAETSRSMVEQGMKVFNGIYKRDHRSLTQELRKLYKLNQIYLDEKGSYPSRHSNSSVAVFRADYSSNKEVVSPSASPFYMSDLQRLNQASAVLQASHASPGYNIYLANRHYLEALKVSDIDELLPDPVGPMAVSKVIPPQMQIEQLKAQTKQMDFQLKLKLEQMKLAANAEKVQGEITLLNAQAEQAMAQAKGVAGGHQIELLNAQIALKKQEREGSLKTLEILSKVLTGQQQQGEQDDNENGVSNGKGGVAGESNHSNTAP